MQQVKQRAKPEVGFMIALFSLKGIWGPPLQKTGLAGLAAAGGISSTSEQVLPVHLVSAIAVLHTLTAGLPFCHCKCLQDGSSVDDIALLAHEITGRCHACEVCARPGSLRQSSIPGALANSLAC